MCFHLTVLYLWITSPLDLRWIINWKNDLQTWRKVNIWVPCGQCCLGSTVAASMAMLWWWALVFVGDWLSLWKWLVRICPSQFWNGSSCCLNVGSCDFSVNQGCFCSSGIHKEVPRFQLMKMAFMNNVEALLVTFKWTTVAVAWPNPSGLPWGQRGPSLKKQPSLPFMLWAQPMIVIMKKVLKGQFSEISYYGQKHTGSSSSPAALCKKSAFIQNG